MPAAVLLRTRRRVVLLTACLLVASVANAQRIWTPAVTISPSAQQSKLPQLAMDGNGNAMATWIREQLAGPPSRLTQASRMTANGLWGPVTNLYGLPSQGAVASETSDVALNALGRGAAVWVRATGSGPADQMVQGAVFNGATWGGPVNLMPSNATARSPRVDVDADGNAIAVWIQSFNGFAVVRAARFQVVGAWSSPVTVSSPTENAADAVALGMDDEGNAVAVWAATPGGVPTLRASQFDELTGAWSLPVTIGPAGRSPSLIRLAVNRSGTAAFVAYRGFDGTHDIVRSAHLDPPSGVWTAPVSLSAGGQHASDLDIAADEAGRAMAIWNRSDGTVRTVQTARFNGGAWESATNRTSGVDTRDVSVDTDAVGNAVAVWTRRDGERYRPQAATYAQNINTWSAALDVPGSTGDASAPRVRLHASGMAVTVWQSFTAAFAVEASRLILDTAPQLGPATVSGPNVSLSWTPGTGAGASGFTVVASRTPGGPAFASFPVGTQTSVTLSAQDGAYYVRVVATVSGQSVSSNEIEVVVGRGPAPAAPSGLVAEVNGNVVTLSWSPPPNVSVAPVQTYYIGAGTTEGRSDLAFFPTGSTDTTYVTPPLPNGNYWVRVRALGAGGIGAPTPDVRVIVGPPPPGAPTLSGGATGPGAVQLQWTAAPAPGVPVTGYQLRAGYQPGQSNAAVLNFDAATFVYAATGIPPGTYYVRVVASSSAGPGETSNEVVVTVP